MGFIIAPISLKIERNGKQIKLSKLSKLSKNDNIYNNIYFSTHFFINAMIHSNNAIAFFYLMWIIYFLYTNRFF